MAAAILVSYDYNNPLFIQLRWLKAFFGFLSFRPRYLSMHVPSTMSTEIALRWIMKAIYSSTTAISAKQRGRNFPCNDHKVFRSSPQAYSEFVSLTAWKVLQGMRNFFATWKLSAKKNNLVLWSLCGTGLWWTLVHVAISAAINI